MERPLVERVTQIGLILLSFGYLLIFFDKGLVLLDEGYIVYGSKLVWRGLIPHRDFYSNFPAGTYWLLGTLYTIFGPSLIVGRWFVLILGTMTNFLVYILARRLLSPPFAIIATGLFLTWGFPLWMMPSHHWNFLAIGLLMVWTLSRYAATRESKWIFGAGVLVATSGIFMQNLALYSMIGAMAFLAVVSYSSYSMSLPQQGGWQRRWMAFGAGVLLVTLVVALYFVIHHALWTMIVQLFIHPMKYAKEPYGGSLYRPVIKWELDTKLVFVVCTTIVTYLPFVVYSVFLMRLMSRIYRKTVQSLDDQKLLYTLIGGSWFIGTITYAQDTIRILYVSPPVFILFAYTLEQFWAQRVHIPNQHHYRIRLPQKMGIGVLTFGIPLILMGYRMAFVPSYLPVKQNTFAYLNIPAGGIFITGSHFGVSPKSFVASLKTLRQFLHQRTDPQEPIAILSSDVVLYFLLDRDDFSRQALSVDPQRWWFRQKDWVQNSPIRPRFVIYNDGSQYDPSVYKKLLAQYSEVRYIPPFHVLTLRSEIHHE